VLPDDGFRLHQYDTEHGQVVWEWRRGTEPRPQFVSRRVALRWMHDWLGMQDDPTHEEDPRTKADFMPRQFEEWLELQRR
jgi:hypothetical protein